MQWSDEELVRRHLQGDRRAFRELVERYTRSIYDLAYRFTGDQAEAEDIVQETCLRVSQALPNSRLVLLAVLWIAVLAGCVAPPLAPVEDGPTQATAIPVAQTTPVAPGPTPALSPAQDTALVVCALEDLMTDIYQRLNPSVVHIRVTVGRGRFVRESSGSGFVLDRGRHAPGGGGRHAIAPGRRPDRRLLRPCLGCAIIVA